MRIRSMIYLLCLSCSAVAQNTVAVPPRSSVHGTPERINFNELAGNGGQYRLRFEMSCQYTLLESCCSEKVHVFKLIKIKAAISAASLFMLHR